VSLNPLRHLSPLGTLAMFLLPFGWGKPVYVNLYNFKRPRRDYLLTSLAGPLANLVLLALCLALMQLTRHTFSFGPRAAAFMAIAHTTLIFAVIANAILAAFNLIPIPPLDGSKIWPVLLPRVKPSFSASTRWAALILLIVLMFSNALNRPLSAVVGTVARAMPIPDAEVFAQRLKAAFDAHKSGRYAETEKLLNEAIAVNPWSAYCYYLRASARGEQLNWQAAGDDIRRALELDKDNPLYEDAQKTILEHVPRAQ
jgi:tetratricopeptide (TPR) repeat protein